MDGGGGDEGRGGDERGCRPSPGQCGCEGEVDHEWAEERGVEGAANREREEVKEAEEAAKRE